MNIAKFEHTGLDKVEKWIEKNDNISEIELKECLKTINISFIAEEIDRVQSTLLCELKASYVQQSQRYVAVKEESYILPKLNEEDDKRALELIQKSFGLYEKMSKLKEGSFKGRPKLENYMYGIPIEDARYILPLSVKTNITIAMTGDKLVDLIKLLKNPSYSNLFKEFKEKLYKLVPNNMTTLIESYVKNEYDFNKINEFYKEDFKKINSTDDMILLNSFSNLDLKVGLGAITSSQPKVPSEVLKLWGEEASTKANGVVGRVLGYGHESIAEQARTTFGMMCSMVTYHQQVRHRLTENHREEFVDIIQDMNREVCVPKTIKESSFYDEFNSLVHEFKSFRQHIMKNYDNDKSFYFLLNCDKIKLIISSNARMETCMLSERICMNAQWEIRELGTKKLNILRKLSPILYEKALPSCINGICKEGKFTCGKAKEMREKFGVQN